MRRTPNNNIPGGFGYHVNSNKSTRMFLTRSLLHVGTWLSDNVCSSVNYDQGWMVGVDFTEPPFTPRLMGLVNHV